MKALSQALLQLAEVLLRVLLSLLPLLERRVLAAERQAAAAEDLAGVVRTYLGYSDPEFAEVLQGRGVPVAVARAEPPDSYAEYGPERDRKAERLEALQQYWYREYGELLDAERLVEEYERLYAAVEARLDADSAGAGAGAGAGTGGTH